jgi:tetratricopeptide (TPR) repeat protein
MWVKLFESENLLHLYSIYTFPNVEEIVSRFKEECSKYLRVEVEHAKTYQTAIISDKKKHYVGWQGAALDKLGKHNGAIECFDKALQVDPNNPYAWTNKGYVLHGLGKYKEAIEYYDKALQVDPNNVLALNIKGAALNKLGRHKEAKELTQKKQGWKRWFT